MTAQTQTGSKTASTARARYQRGSPTKFRLVADTIRGKNVDVALGLLEGSPRGAAGCLQKLLHSAVANAEVLDSALDVDRLYIMELFVDPGPSMPPRIRPQPMGRAYPIIKRTSHLTLKLAVREA